MVLNASLCDAPHINELELSKYRECICRRIAPAYAANLCASILNRGRNAKEREISSSTMYSVLCTCVDLIIIIIYYIICIYIIIYILLLLLLTVRYFKHRLIWINLKQAAIGSTVYISTNKNQETRI